MNEYRPNSDEPPKETSNFFSRNTAAAVADAAKLRGRQAALFAQLKKLETIDHPALLAKVGLIVHGSSIEVPEKEELGAEIDRLNETVAKVNGSRGLERVRAKVDAGLVSGQISYAFQKLGESAVAFMKISDDHTPDLSAALLEVNSIRAKIESLRAEIHGLSVSAASDPRLREAIQAGASNAKAAYRSTSQELNSRPPSKRSNRLVWILTVLIPPVGLWLTWGRSFNFSVKRKLLGTVVGLITLAIIASRFWATSEVDSFLVSEAAADIDSGHDARMQLQPGAGILGSETDLLESRKDEKGDWTAAMVHFTKLRGPMMDSETVAAAKLANLEMMTEFTDASHDAEVEPKAFASTLGSFNDYSLKYQMSLPGYERSLDTQNGKLNVRIAAVKLGAAQPLKVDGQRAGVACFVVEYGPESTGIAGTKVLLAYFDCNGGKWSRSDLVKVYSRSSAVGYSGAEAGILPDTILHPRTKGDLIPNDPSAEEVRKKREADNGAIPAAAFEGEVIRQEAGYLWIWGRAMGGILRNRDQFDNEPSKRNCNILIRNPTSAMLSTEWRPGNLFRGSHYFQAYTIDTGRSGSEVPVYVYEAKDKFSHEELAWGLWDH